MAQTKGSPITSAWPATANPGTTSPRWPADSPKTYRFTPRHDCRLRAADPYPDHALPLITSRNQPSPRQPKNIRLICMSWGHDRLSPSYVRVSHEKPT
jgi:hypothetical protein